MSWVEVVNEMQGDGDQVQHSVPLTWRKHIKHWWDTEEHYINITPRHMSMGDEQMRNTFFLLSEEGSSSLPGEDIYRLLDLNVSTSRIFLEEGGVVTYISSRVLLFWRLPSSPPFAVSILQAYFWKENIQLVTKLVCKEVDFMVKNSR